MSSSWSKYIPRILTIDYWWKCTSVTRKISELAFNGFKFMINRHSSNPSSRNSCFETENIPLTKGRSLTRKSSDSRTRVQSPLDSNPSATKPHSSSSQITLGQRPIVLSRSGRRNCSKLSMKWSTPSAQKSLNKRVPTSFGNAALMDSYFIGFAKRTPHHPGSPLSYGRKEYHSSSGATALRQSQTAPKYPPTFSWHRLTK